MHHLTRRVRRAGIFLAASALLLLAATAAAAPSDPLAVSGAQDWLARVLPAGVEPPAPADTPPIAVIEQGFDPDHPEMQGGWVKLMRRPTWTGDLVADLEDVAHGTAVAAVIGAPRDGQGIEGVLPGTRVWVYGTTLRCPDVAAAVRQAVRDGARVVNVSAGFEVAGACQEFRDATSYAFGMGVLTVAAAGNYRPRQRWIQPGNDLHVLTVGALTALDQPAGFSQQTVHLDVMAPGEGVLTAVPLWFDDQDEAEDGYARLDGTSFAAPIAAAAAAWIMAERPSLSAHQVAEAIRSSARDLGRRGWDRAYGFGALDIRAALRIRAVPDDPLEPNDDIKWVSGRAGFSGDPILLERSPTATIRAQIDVVKDPWDVYRFWIPPGRSAVITLRLRGVAADLYVWQPNARSTGQRGMLVASSRRPGLETERVHVVNHTARRPAFVEVRARRGRDLSGSYVLRLERR